MRSLKALISTLAIGVAAVALAAGASAATATYDSAADTVSASGFNSVDGQRTVLIVEEAKWNAMGTTPLADTDIMYIDQFANADAATALAGMGVHADFDPAKTYVVVVGNETTGYETAVLAGQSLAKGDADGSGTVNENDAISILDYCLELVAYTAAQEAAADTDGGGAINENDAIDILDYCLELPSYVAGTK